MVREEERGEKREERRVGRGEERREWRVGGWGGVGANEKG